MKNDTPEWLGKVGRAKWRALVKQLGTVPDNQRDSLALLCAAWENYLAAQESIRDKGTVITSGTRLFVNPSCNIADNERKTILKISKMFGFTPDLAPSSDTTSPFGDLIDD